MIMIPFILVPFAFLFLFCPLCKSDSYNTGLCRLLYLKQHSSCPHQKKEQPGDRFFA